MRGTDTLPFIMTFLLMSPVSSYRGYQVSKQLRCFCPIPTCSKSGRPSWVRCLKILSSLSVSTVMDLGVSHGSFLGDLWAGHPSASTQEQCCLAS